jgi:hypothetical protein
MRILVAIILFTSINSFAQNQISIQEKLKKIAVSELKKKLNDPDSYKPASWGELREEKTNFSYSTIFKHLLNEESEVTKQLNNKRSYIENELRKKDLVEFFRHDPPNDSLINLAKISKIKLEFSLDSLIKLRESEKSKFKEVFSNYIIEHSFRARNASNGLILTTYYFRFSKDLKLIEYGDIDRL